MIENPQITQITQIRGEAKKKSLGRMKCVLCGRRGTPYQARRAAWQ